MSDSTEDFGAGSPEGKTRRNEGSDLNLSTVKSDLRAAAEIAFQTEDPGPEEVLRSFREPPSPSKYRRAYAFYDRSSRSIDDLVERYERNLGKFAEFLNKHGVG